MTSLDPSQHAFIEAPAGHIRLLAPAGCGKTHSILYRCKNLSEAPLGRKPKILIVTFTRPATEELKARIAATPDFHGLQSTTQVSTLNAWGWRRIPRNNPSALLLTDFNDNTREVEDALEPLRSNHELVDKSLRNRGISYPRLLAIIDHMKVLGFHHLRHADDALVEQHIENLEEWQLEPHLRPLLDDIHWYLAPRLLAHEWSRSFKEPTPLDTFRQFFLYWRDATQRLSDAHIYTFEDQKYIAQLLLDNSNTGGDGLHNRTSYDHVLVDEFQDINPLDLNLIKGIVQRDQATLTIVGDDDQAIYEWRVATPEYILNPERHFDMSFHTYTLQYNYRSPTNIIRHSQRLISNNTRRIPKAIEAGNKSLEDASIQVVELQQSENSLPHVHYFVKRSISSGIAPDDIAILGRSRKQMLPWQVYCISESVPFYVAKDMQLLRSRGFELLLEVLRIHASKDVFQLRHQIIEEMLMLYDRVTRNELRQREAVLLRDHLGRSKAETLVQAAQLLENLPRALSHPQQGVENDSSISRSVRAFLGASTVSQAIGVLATDFEGFREDSGRGEQDIFYADPPLNELAGYAERFGRDYERFVADLDRAKREIAFTTPVNEAVQLMTAHRAKGREFDAVVLLDTVDVVWPSGRAETPAELEAERRVFYVAFTRARRRVLMIHNGKDGIDFLKPSRYIAELELEAGSAET